MQMIGTEAAEREVIAAAKRAAKWLPPAGFDKGTAGWVECQGLAAAVRRLRAEERARDIAENARRAQGKEG